MFRPDGRELQTFENKTGSVEKKDQFEFKVNETQTFIAGGNFPEGVIYIGALLY